MLNRFALPVLAIAVLGLAIWVAVLSSQASAQQDRIDTLESGVAFLAGESALLQDGISSIASPARQFISELDARLIDLETTAFAVTVDVNETLPVRTEFAFARTIEIPIKTEIPINEVIDTTITIDGPLGVEIPINVSVPVDVIVPIDLVVPFTIDETFPVSVDIPIDLAVPINVSLADTPFAALAAELRAGLVEIDQAFAQLER